MTQGWRVCLLCLCLGHGSLVQVEAAPICTHGTTGCHSLTLEELFDRVLQHSARVYGLSTDLHTEFEHYFPFGKNQVGRRKCHTSSIQAPHNKDIAQSLTRAKLTEVVLRLLAAWRDPLVELHERILAQQQQDLNTHDGSKALEIAHLVHQLQNGVQSVAQRMQLLGIITNSLNTLSSFEEDEPSELQSASDWVLSSDQNLLYCLRRDTNKVHSYLKTLKCAILPRLTC